MNIDDVIADIRDRGTRLSPYRLGLEVGRRKLEDEVECPYEAGSKAHQHYLDGIMHTREQ